MHPKRCNFQSMLFILKLILFHINMVLTSANNNNNNIFLYAHYKNKQYILSSNLLSHPPSPLSIFLLSHPSHFISLYLFLTSLVLSISFPLIPTIFHIIYYSPSPPHHPISYRLYIDSCCHTAWVMSLYYLFKS